MALIDINEPADGSDIYRFCMSDSGRTVMVAVSREAAQDVGGFHSNRARFAAIAAEKQSRGNLEPSGTIFIRTADL
jgi:hypothetical protein